MSVIAGCRSWARPNRLDIVCTADGQAQCSSAGRPSPITQQPSPVGTADNSPVLQLWETIGHNATTQSRGDEELSSHHRGFPDMVRRLQICGAGSAASLCLDARPRTKFPIALPCSERSKRGGSSARFSTRDRGRPWLREHGARNVADRSRARKRPGPEPPRGNRR